MASGVYNCMKGKDGVDWASGADSTYKTMLVTSSYTPDPDHNFPNASGLAASEISGGSYARQSVASRVKAKNNTTNTYDHSANNPTFTAITGAPKYAITYKVVATDADHILVCWNDLGTQSLSAADFMVKWNAGASSGIMFQGT